MVSPLPCRGCMPHYHLPLYPGTDPLPSSGGMIAPILGGILLMIDRSFPVYTSVVIFAFAGFCVLLLQEKPREAGKERVIAH